jgi:retron-type reverse transcriptase
MSPTVSTKLRRIAQQAVDYPDGGFRTLADLIDVDFLREAYRRTRKDSAPGIDRVTAQAYAEHLDEHLRDLHERLRSGRYQAPPRGTGLARQGGRKETPDRQADG